MNTPKDDRRRLWDVAILMFLVAFSLGLAFGHRGAVGELARCFAATTPFGAVAACQDWMFPPAEATPVERLPVNNAFQVDNRGRRR